MLKMRINRIVSRISLSWHIAIFSGLLVLLALPWLNVWRAALPERFIGIDGAFFASLVLVPALIGVVLFLYSKRADDLERHMRKFENE